MKDAVGNDLNVGDRVVMTDSHYKELIHGEVVGFTPKMIKVRVNRLKNHWLGQGQDGNVVHKTSGQLCLVITRAEKIDAMNAAFDEGRGY